MVQCGGTIYRDLCQDCHLTMAMQLDTPPGVQSALKAFFRDLLAAANGAACLPDGHETLSE